jgi:hypothetical protein
VLLNFGLDMDGKKRRRQLVPGLSRLMIVVLVSFLYSQKRLKQRYFFMGLVLRILPRLNFYVVRGIYAILNRLFQQNLNLLPNSKLISRFEQENVCSICLEEGCDHVLNECDHQVFFFYYYFFFFSSSSSFFFSSFMSVVWRCGWSAIRTVLCVNVKSKLQIE